MDEIDIIREKIAGGIDTVDDRIKFDAFIDKCMIDGFQETPLSEEEIQESLKKFWDLVSRFGVL